MVTLSSTERSAARTAIHRETNGSRSPAAANSWGRTPRTEARGPSSTLMTSATVMDSAGRASSQPPSGPLAAQQATATQRAEDVVEEPRGYPVLGGEDRTLHRPTGSGALGGGQRGHGADAIVDLVRDPHAPTVPRGTSADHPEAVGAVASSCSTRPYSQSR